MPLIRINTLDGLRDLEVAWQGLFVGNRYAHFSNSFPLVLASAATRFKQSAWRVYATTHAGELQSAAFGVRTTLTLGRVRIPIFQVGSEFIADILISSSQHRDELSSLLAAIFESERVAIIDFGKLTEPAFRAIRDAISNGGFKATWNYDGYGYVSDCRISRDEMYQQLSHDRRAHIRRKSRRLDDAYEVRFERLESDDVAENLRWFEHFLVLEASGWKGQNRTAIQHRPGSEQYFRSVIEAASRLGQMRWYRLTADGRTISMELGLKAGRAFWPPKTAYDESFARYSPGMELVHRFYLDCIDDPSIDRIDWIAAPPSLDAWRPARQPYFHLRIFSRSSIGRTMHALGSLRDAARRRFTHPTMDDDDRERRFL